jgi:RNA polymerase sigma-70 factor (ECF subfamily)
MKVDDRTLVHQSQQGDFKALEALIVRYQDRIYNVIKKICANSEDSAELTQQTFVKVIENIKNFECKSSFYTWVFRIAVNLTLTFCKKRSKTKIYSLNAASEEELSRTNNSLQVFLRNKKSVDPSKAAENQELGELVMEKMKILTDEHRTVLILRDIEGMSYSQIAQALDLELGTVRSRISRARENLRKVLEEFWV